MGNHHPGVTDFSGPCRPQTEWLQGKGLADLTPHCDNYPANHQQNSIDRRHQPAAPYLLLFDFFNFQISLLSQILLTLLAFKQGLINVYEYYLFSNHRPNIIKILGTHS